MIPMTLKERAATFEIADTDWYLEAWMRASKRINDETTRPTGPNLERLARHLQSLYDRIVAGLEDEKTKAAHARAAAIAINHAVSDRGLPRELLRNYTGDNERDSA